MFEVKNISKTYAKKNIKAVNNISFMVSDGEIFGLVGPNGAGKSTLIKMAVGLLKIDNGDIVIGDKSISNEPYDAKKLLGYVSDNHQVMDRLTGLEYLHFIANLFGLDKETAEKDIKTLTERFGLQSALNDLIKSYSHGMKQKICIISTLLHKPYVWILDEPLTGLDPQSTYELKKVMKEYAESGKIVIFSSHLLEMVEKLCDRVAVINKGELVALGTTEEIKKQFGGYASFEEAFIDITARGKGNE